MTDETIINKAVDPSNLTELEEKHVPLIEAPEIAVTEQTFKAKVTIGALRHVMEDSHYIEWIKLSLNGYSLGEVKLTPSDNPVAEFEVTFSEEMIAVKEIKQCRIHGFNVCGECGTKSVLTELIALANCNVHGLWEGTKLIEVKSSKSLSEGKTCKWEMKNVK